VSPPATVTAFFLGMATMGVINEVLDGLIRRGKEARRMLLASFEEDEMEETDVKRPPSWICPCHKLTFREKDKFKGHLEMVKAQVQQALNAAA